METKKIKIEENCFVFCSKSTPAIAGDTNPSTLATNFHFLYHPVPQIKLESKIQTGSFPFTAASGLGNSIGIAEYLGKNSTISLALYSPSRTTGRMTIGFLHSFDSTFCAGAELLTEWQRSAMKYRLAIAARYVCVLFVDARSGVKNISLLRHL